MDSYTGTLTPRFQAKLEVKSHKISQNDASLDDLLFTQASTNWPPLSHSSIRSPARSTFMDDSPRTSCYLFGQESERTQRETLHKDLNTKSAGQLSRRSLENQFKNWNYLPSCCTTASTVADSTENLHKQYINSRNKLTFGDTLIMDGPSKPKGLHLPFYQEDMDGARLDSSPNVDETEPGEEITVPKHGHKFIRNTPGYVNPQPYFPEFDEYMRRVRAKKPVLETQDKDIEEKIRLLKEYLDKIFGKPLYSLTPTSQPKKKSIANPNYDQYQEFLCDFSKTISACEIRVQDLEGQNRRLLQDKRKEFDNNKDILDSTTKLYKYVIETIDILDSYEKSTLRPFQQKFSPKPLEKKQEPTKFFQPSKNSLGIWQPTSQVNRLDTLLITKSNSLFGQPASARNYGSVDPNTALIKALEDQIILLKGKVNTLKTENSSLQAENNELNHKLASSKGSIESLIRKNQSLLQERNNPLENRFSVLKASPRMSSTSGNQSAETRYTETLESSRQSKFSEESAFKTLATENDLLMIIQTQANSLEKRFSLNGGNIKIQAIAKLDGNGYKTQGFLERKLKNSHKKEDSCKEIVVFSTEEDEEDLTPNQYSFAQKIPEFKYY